MQERVGHSQSREQASPSWPSLAADLPSPPIAADVQHRFAPAVALHAPYASGGGIRDPFCEQIGGTDHTTFITERTRLHEVYIREEAKNKRIGLFLSFALIVLATVVLMFAPEGRQTLSYWVGAALLIFAAGASGFARLWGKTENFSFGVDQDKRALSKTS